MPCFQKVGESFGRCYGWHLGAKSTFYAYYLLPSLDFGQARIHLGEFNPIEFESYRFDSLNFFYGMAARSKLRNAA